MQLFNFHNREARRQLQIILNGTRFGHTNKLKHLYRALTFRKYRETIKTKITTRNNQTNKELKSSALTFSYSPGNYARSTCFLNA